MSFKDSMGRWFTKSLFYEPSGYQINDALFTMGDEDKTVKGKKLISLRKRFVDSDDITGYTIAKNFLGGWQHWQAICNSTIGPEIEKWKEELEVKLRAMGLKKAIESASSGNFNAARFLTEVGWEKRSGAGRPSKAEVEREKRIQAAYMDSVEGDLRRLEELDICQ